MICNTLNAPLHRALLLSMCLLLPHIAHSGLLDELSGERTEKKAPPSQQPVATQKTADPLSRENIGKALKEFYGSKEMQEQAERVARMVGQEKSSETSKNQTSPYSIKIRGDGPPSIKQIFNYYTLTYDRMSPVSVTRELRGSAIVLEENQGDAFLYYENPILKSCKKEKGGADKSVDQYRCQYSIDLQVFESKADYPHKPYRSLVVNREDVFRDQQGKWDSYTLWRDLRKLFAGNGNSTGDEIDEHNRRVQERIAEDIAVDVLLGK